MRRCIILWALLLIFSWQGQGIVAASLAADPGDESWSTDYHHAGIPGYLKSMFSRPGAVYVGGYFAAITDVPVLNVARLEMSGGVVTQVVPLGVGLDRPPEAFCEHNGDLVVGGGFNKSGATTLTRVARWDGSVWHPLGDGLPDTWVRAIASYQGQIYAGAYGAVYAWDGLQWSQAFETDGAVTALIVHDGLLYVGGEFALAAGQAHTNVFAWDGAQVLTLGAGFPRAVSSATAGAAGVVFAGTNDSGWGLVSRWDGAAWIVEMDNNIVFKVAYFGDDLVTTAAVYLGGSMFAYRVLTNQTGTWETLGDFNAEFILEHEGLLLGHVDAGVEPGILSPGLIAHNGVGFQGVFTPNNGFDGNFDAMAALGTGVVVGGDYAVADGQEFDGSAYKSSGAWFRWGNRSDLLTSFPGAFEELVVVGSEIFGLYNYVDYDVGATVLAKLAWDVDQWRWQALDPGTWFWGGLQPIGSELYNVGYGGLNRIDLTTGAATLVSGLDLNGGVFGTCEYQGSLVMCGSFSTNHGLPVSNVMRYANNTWVDVGDPLPGQTVMAIAPLDGQQLAASVAVDGYYGRVHRVSLFDGVSWSTLPGDFDGKVTHLVFHEGRLFAGGAFNMVGPMPSPGISIWTGDQWAMVGSGLSGGIYARVTDMISVAGSLFVTGGFSFAGGRSSAGFAEWTGDPTLFTGAPSNVPDDTPVAARLLGDAYPNPFNPRTEVAFVVPASGRVQIGIFDMRGNRVRELVNERIEAGSHARTWNGLDDTGLALPSGVYFARMLTGNRAEAVKLTLVR